MSDSILTSTKKILGLEESYTAFDQDIITHINTVFATLQQLGLGPDDGFMIEDDSALWSDYIQGQNSLNQLKTYLYLKVRMLFDPPATSFHITAMENQIRELEWRISTNRELQNWSDPNLGTILDGGTP